MVPREVRRWLLANTVAGPAIVNLLLGALYARLAVGSGSVPTWPHGLHGPDLLADTAGTLFVLPLLTSVIVSPVIGTLKRRALTPVLVPAGRAAKLHARVPSAPLRRGVAAGGMCAIVLGPIAAILLAVVDPGTISGGAYVGYHSVLAAALGAAITPPLALLALLDRGDAPAIEPQRTDSSDVVLDVVRVSKKFGQGDNEVVALDGVDLTVTRGSFVAIMGPSGSGKSTLLHICGALLSATAGSVSVAGVPLSSLDDRELTRLRREHIGFVFQFFNLLPTLSALDNVMMAGLIAGQRPAASAERALELLDVVEMSDRAHHLPSQMSAGQQQRVSVARALYHNPTLLLADEPTGSLDADNARAVLRLLRDLADRRQTVVMITHNREAASEADRVVVLAHGRCVRDTPAESLVAAG